MDEITEKFLKRYWDSFTPSTIAYDDALILKGARGCELFDISGKSYLDFCSQAGVMNIGHNHPFFVEAQKAFWETVEREHIPWYLIASDFHFHFFVTVGGKKIEISQPALAELLKKHTFGKDTRFIQQVTGVTANNAAIKFIQKLRPGRKQGFAFRGAFHGRQGAALGATYGKPIQRAGFDIQRTVDTHFPFVRSKEELDRCYEELKEFNVEDHGFIMFESGKGEGGVEFANRYTIEFLEYLRSEYDILLLCDDIQEGFGRTGKWWSFQNYGFVPDIVTISKSMGGGDPISAAFFNAKNPKLKGWEEALAVGWDSSTFQWNPHAVFSAIITIMILEKEKLVEKAAENSGFFQAALEGAIEYFYNVSEPNVAFTLHELILKGLGFHFGIEFRKVNVHQDKYIPDPEFRNVVLGCLQRNGIITLSAGNPNINPTIRFMPPLTITKAEIEIFALRLQEALKEAHEITKKK
ncbi:MAG: aminotransferase class III-fold pyridoxal phosphate-dependent enzyme [bacterium]|nr:aminotransferase class III-fold pyridoxal phosphate-dependent enzyme [bacterium]